jgi:hypothetical protein
LEVAARSARRALVRRPAAFWRLILPYALLAACGIALVASVTSDVLAAVFPVPRERIFAVLAAAGLVGSGWFGERSIVRFLARRDRAQKLNGATHRPVR